MANLSEPELIARHGRNSKALYCATVMKLFMTVAVEPIESWIREKREEMHNG